MAIDEAILHAVSAGESRSTLRFYQWEPACLSLGFGQRASEVDTAAVERLGYTWVRRPTGGRSILHTRELTYSIITPENDPRVAGGIIPSYRNLSRGLLNGLNRLGAGAMQAKGDMPQNPDQGAACFDTPSHYEVTVNGKKLVGSAQLRRKGVVLQHGTLPLHGDLGDIFAVLALPAPIKQVSKTQLYQRAATLEEALGQKIAFETAADALAAGFADELHLHLESGSLSELEEGFVQQFREDTYGHASWNKRR
jgi:lipoate-protein ligase A